MIVTALALTLMTASQAQDRSNFLAVPARGTTELTTGRFYDNRNRVIRQVSEIEARARTEQASLAATRRHQAQREALAARLDRLIGAGQCAEAERIAGSSPYADIAGEVTRVCAAR